MFDLGNLVGEIPNKVIRYHLAIQKKMESKKPKINQMMKGPKLFFKESFQKKEYFKQNL